ncbi:MAG: hypothetical protein AB7I96_10785 [Candidatus Dadabacteria bacterium]
MKPETFTIRASSMIVLLSSLVIISLMSYGGCGGGSGGGDDGGGSGPVPTATFTPPTPTPTTPPGATGSPDCFSVDVSLGCPAVSLERSRCRNHDCNVIDDSGDDPFLVTSFLIPFGLKCTALDCVTLECHDTSPAIDDSIIVIESVSGIPVSEGEETAEPNGKPEGTIYFDDSEYRIECSFVGSDTVP